MEKKIDKLDKLIIMLKHYIAKEWYGKVEVSIEAGNIVNLKITENIKP